MPEQLRLMCVLAHPDDESLGTGGILARYAAEGVATYLVTATRGECGWFGAEQEYPGPQALGKIREAELLAAANVLGLREVQFLNYIDSDFDQADPAEAVAQIVTHLRRIQPQVVVTFGPFGGYGHPDHIAISQLTTAASVCAADATYGDGAPHRVPKENWAITTRIDTHAHWRTVWRAISCHRSQLPGYAGLEQLLEQQYQALLGSQTFYRAFSLVNGGRQLERDLFAGLR